MKREENKDLVRAALLSYKGTKGLISYLGTNLKEVDGYKYKYNINSANCFMELAEVCLKRIEQDLKDKDEAFLKRIEQGYRN